jgi:two-component system LytT family response regulator
MIRVVVADNDQAARRRLVRLLSRLPDAAVVGEASDGPSAVALVKEAAPDVLFLDIEMPEGSGFDVVEALAGMRAPVIIFVTAFDRHAVRVCEVHAAEYLLKPFDEERLSTVWDRARGRLRVSGDRSAHLRAALTELRRGRTPGYHERILVTASGRATVLEAADVEWVEAAANYVRLHVAGATHLLRESMTGFESQLDPSRFMRVHRSAIVNVDHIEEIQPSSSGDRIIILRSGVRVRLSRTHRRAFEARFGERKERNRAS